MYILYDRHKKISASDVDTVKYQTCHRSGVIQAYCSYIWALLSLNMKQLAGAQLKAATQDIIQMNKVQTPRIIDSAP